MNKEIERKPYTYSEYWAIKYIASVLNCLCTAKALEPRLSRIPDGLKDWRIAQAKMQKVFENLCRSIDTAHLKQMCADLKLTTIYLRNKGAAKFNPDDGDFVLVPKNTHMEMVRLLQENICMMCDKEGKDAKRCKLRKLLDSTFPYEMPSSDRCVYNEYDPTLQESDLDKVMNGDDESYDI